MGKARMEDGMGEWIEWSGGKQPVADDVIVEVKLGVDGDSQKIDTGEASVWLWEHEKFAVLGDYHLTAYRVVA